MLYLTLKKITNNAKELIKSKNLSNKINHVQLIDTNLQTETLSRRSSENHNARSFASQGTNSILSLGSIIYALKSIRLLVSAYSKDVHQKTFSFGFYYLRGLAVILFIDACLTDDEPL